MELGLKDGEGAMVNIMLEILNFECDRPINWRGEFYAAAR